MQKRTGKNDTVKAACKLVMDAASTLQNGIEEIDQYEIDMLDIAIKNLIATRNVIDFKSRMQLTGTNWEAIRGNLS